MTDAPTDSVPLAARIPDLADCRVLCLGDVMLDRFVYGDVSRISPEAPIPVFRIERETSMLGGAGNVVRNITSLGATACFLSAVGDDQAGRDLTRMVGAEARVEPYLQVERGRISTVKTRHIAGGQQLLRADSETVRPIDGDTAETLMRIAADEIGHCKVVVFSDYAKGVLTPDLVATVIAAARDAGKPVVVDPKGADFNRYRGANVITPNRKELGMATAMPTNTPEEVALAAQAAVEAGGFDAVLTTCGADGINLLTAQRSGTHFGPAEHLPATAREVFDVSGAGDTVIASFALALGSGASLIEAARLANHAAGIVVGKVGTAVVYPDDLLRAIHAGEWSLIERKIAGAAGAAEQVARWRAKGRRIGFTNGCFDLLHPGHVSLLAQARAACDRLVVGLNSDASVTRLKGAGRPVQTEAARCQVLASLASVDLVVVFEEDTPLALLEALRPDLLVKGADYALDQVVGGDLVRGYGGRVMLIDLAPGHSTSETIARITK